MAFSTPFLMLYLFSTKKEKHTNHGLQLPSAWRNGSYMMAAIFYKGIKRKKSKPLNWLRQAASISKDTMEVNQMTQGVEHMPARRKY
jgi:hypothetical protein